MNKKILRERRTKFLALLMSLLMVFSLLPIEALAYNCITDGGQSAHSYGSNITEIPATCMSPKILRKFCTRNNGSYDNCDGHLDTTEGEINPDAHDWDWTNVQINWAEDYSTCTATLVCKLNPNHKETKTVNATIKSDTTSCTQDGSITYSAVFEGEIGEKTTTVDIKAQGHQWGDWFEDPAQFESYYKKAFVGETLKAATCMVAGYHARQCTVCGIQEGKALNDSNAHIWDKGKITKKATCTEKGELTFTCTLNNTHTMKEEIAIDENAHSWDEGKVTTAPTCSSKGEKTFTCTLNKAHTKKEEINIDPNAHSWDEGKVTTAPTCSSKGEKLFTCTLNKEHTKKEEIDIDPNAHSWDEGEVTTAPTCSSKGEKTFTCTLNKAHTMKEEIAIDENAHSWDEGKVTTAPTCSSKGEKTFTCTLNKEHTKKEEIDIDPNAHSWDEGKVTTAPTCSSKGEKLFTCTLNKEHTKKEEIDIDPNAHSWDEGKVTTAPTCSSKGEKLFTCTLNKEHTKKEEIDIDPNAHSWDEGKVTTAPTCSSKGEKTFTCTLNKEHTKKEEIDIDPNAHSWDEGKVTTAPTCSSKGEKLFTCTLNKEHTKTEEIDINPDAHAWDAGQVTKAATCTEAGEKTFTCTLNKDHTKTEEIAIDANAHVWGNPVYTWWEDNSQVTAARTCTLNANHVESETVQTTATVLEAPTHDAKGRMLYTAEFTHPAFETQTRTVEIPPKGHTLIHHEAIPPTPEQEGRKEYWECPDCGDIFEDEQGEKKTTPEELILPKVVLVYHAQVDPTCTKDGTKEFWAHPQNETKFTAAANGTEVSDSDLRIAALGHNFSNWAVTQAPTLLEKGLEKRVCLRPGCGYEETRDIPIKGKIGQQYTIGDLKVEISDLTTCTVTIVGWSGNDEELTLPDEVEILGYNFTVTGIGAGAFAGSEGIKKLILGEKVEVIEKEAFKGCTGLEVLNAMHSEKLRVIGESAFEGCEKLATVLLNVTSLETLEDSVFAGISPEAEFNLFCMDVQKLAEAGALLRTDETGWLPDMTLTAYQYYDSSFDKYDVVEEGTLVINEETVRRP